MKKLIVIAFMLLGFVSNVSAGTAIPAYFWNFSAVQSDEHNEWDDVQNRTSTQFNHGGTVISETVVVGYSNPVVKFNNSQMQLLQVIPIDTNGDNTYDVWIYYHIGSGVSGNLEVTDWSGSTYGVRDTVYVK